jgi:carbon storage regulator
MPAFMGWRKNVGLCFVAALDIRTHYLYTRACNGSTSKEIKDMLVLSRKESERIRLGDSIVVTVVRVAGDKVRLGIEAPSDILVLREELEPQAPAVASPAIDR